MRTLSHPALVLLAAVGISTFSDSLYVRVKTDRNLPMYVRSNKQKIELDGGRIRFDIPVPYPGASAFVRLRIKSRHRFDSPDLIAPDGTADSGSSDRIRSFIVRGAIWSTPGTWTISSKGRGRIKFKSCLTMPPGTATIPARCN